MVKELKSINAENWQQEVLDSHVPVLVYFYGDQCGPCRLMKEHKVLETVAEEYGDNKVRVVKFSTDEDPDFVNNLPVHSLPSMLLVMAGTPVDAAVGYKTPEDLKKFLDEYV